jgi:HAD superfamily hydrolase (TIGR01509 family)
MRYAAVLFDLDGVLIESYDVWFHLLNDAARHWRRPAISPEDFHAAWGQGVQADREVFFPDQSVTEIEAFYDERFLHHADHLKTDPDVPAVFADLAARRIPTALITNTPAPLATQLVERAGGTPDVVVGGTDVVNAKPAPDMVLLACERLGVAPAHALVVGDSEFDVRAARAAGCPFAGVGIPGDLALGTVGDLIAHLGD